MTVSSLLVVAIAAVYLAIVVLAIFEVLTKNGMNTDKKVFWVLIIMLTSPIGLIIYYIRRQRI